MLKLEKKKITKNPSERPSTKVLFQKDESNQTMKRLDKLFILSMTTAMTCYIYISHGLFELNVYKFDDISWMEERNELELLAGHDHHDRYYFSKKDMENEENNNEEEEEEATKLRVDKAPIVETINEEHSATSPSELVNPSYTYPTYLVIVKSPRSGSTFLETLLQKTPNMNSIFEPTLSNARRHFANCRSRSRQQHHQQGQNQRQEEASVKVIYAVRNKNIGNLVIIIYS